MKPVLAIIAVIVAILALTQLLISFYDWNQEQSCATGGGRSCGGRTQLNQHL
jgi:hypothetical protein